ncbi:MAG: hypothetical protein OHK0056_33420 [Bacteriovoracaceae bacterium]
MTPSKELLFRLLIISVGVWIFGRYLVPLLWSVIADYFTGQKKKGSDHDLDLMIEGKKQILRSQMGMNAAISSDAQKKKSSATHQFYKDLFLEKSKNGENTVDLKEVLSLWDSLEWGVSEKINQLAQKFSRSIGVRVEGQSLFDIIKICDRRELFLPPVGKDPLNFQEICSILEALVFADIFLFGKEEAELARKLNCRVEVMMKLRETYGQYLQGRELDKAKIEALKSSDPWSYAPQEKELLLIKWIKTKKGLKSKQDVLNDLTPLLSFFQTLLPLPSLKNTKDLDGALALFSADQSTPFETIKKRYKKMASERHPDKLSAMGIPSEFEKIATENFAQIQMAYNIINEHKKD